ncbi:MAG: S8 family serine peptidase [Bacteroidales bacterium]|nr:S8 family serine peptidase [Bacteroidales bacterium]
MKKPLLIAIMLLLAIAGMAQDHCYWVFFTDKSNTQFDPYTYFDAKAIERYQHCGADLYDISNYPLNTNYVNTVGGYASEVFGESRWLNAVGVTATQENAMLIEQLPFVAKVQEMVSNGTLATVDCHVAPQSSAPRNDNYRTLLIPHSEFRIPNSSPTDILTDQLKRFGGQYFIDKGIDGKGLRVCVMDGGFPGVDTHNAFKHLRDNHQILKTYNFPNKKEDVYGWSSHGTMVLSCIAGINEKGQKMGLATGAEFLLARTEIDPEPFKEEVWWAQGAEWADKNGADIINSSLGYGKDRHWTKDMDGTSYVAKAANKAVEKGILICNSAGNEGSDKNWMTIITPADAENVLCVGGIDANLENYRHISFSSYGPSADKRRKPNVVAFGEASVANPKGGITTAAGTSFSSPLTAGFCACAWQTKRNLTALQMKAEIEKSADLYPYFDYAYGYGVPQAAYFTGDLKPAERSFNIVQEKDGVRITVANPVENKDMFISVEGADGVLLGYYKTHPGTDDLLLKNKELGEGKKLNVSYNGFYDSCPIHGMGGDIKLKANSNYRLAGNDGTFQKTAPEGWQETVYFQFDYNLGTNVWNGFSRHFAYGRRHFYGKTYKFGFGWGIDLNRFTAKNSLGISDRKTTMRQAQFHGELLQRIVMRRLGFNWDLGAYGGVNLTRRVYTEDEMKFAVPDPTWNYDDEVTSHYTGCKAMNRFEYGATTRISYTFMNAINLGIYARYRLSDIITKQDILIGSPNNQPSPWSFGIELEIMP